MHFHPYWQPSQWWCKLPQIPHLEKNLRQLESCQNKDGGFGNKPGAPSYMECLFYALVILGLYDSTQRVYPGALDFILSRKNLDGGFCDEPGRKSSLYNTFFALISLNMIDALSFVDRERTIRYIISLKQKNGGFIRSRGEKSDIVHSFWGILSLEILNALDEIDSESLLKFVYKCKHPSGAFSSVPNGSPYVDYTFQALAILYSFNKLDKLSTQDKNKIINFLCACQKENGRFGECPSATSSLSSTLWAVSSLNILQATDTIEIKQLIDFIAKPYQTIWHIFCSTISLIYLIPQEIVVAPRISDLEIIKMEKKNKKYFFHLRNISELNVSCSTPPAKLIERSSLKRLVSSMIKLKKLIEEVKNKKIPPFEIDFSSYLKEIGIIIYHMLPEPTRLNYSNLRRVFLTFGIDESLAFAPWELLYDGQSFACLKHAVSRYITYRTPKNISTTRYLKDRLDMLIIGTTAPSGAAEECEKLYGFLNENSILNITLLVGKNANKPNIKMILESKGCDILHLSGHIEHMKKKVHWSMGMPLDDDNFLTPYELVKWMGNKRCSLVFVNSCRSAEQLFLENFNKPYFQFYSFCQAFTSKGIPFVGSYFPLYDISAMNFVISFYSILFHGYPLAEALRSARESSYISNEGRGLAWASYLLYGNPLSRITKFGLTSS